MGYTLAQENPPDVTPVRPAPVPILISGPARPGRRTKLLAPRLRPGDVALLDHADLDSVAARALADARPVCVVNARPFLTGRYPTRGPSVLLSAGIALFQLPEPSLWDKIGDGDKLLIDTDGTLFVNGRPLCQLTAWDMEKVAAATAAARANLGAELERFARNTLSHLDADKSLLLDPPPAPPVPGVKIKGRHALIVVRGAGYQDDLLELRPYLRDMRPVLIAVDGAADALLALGHRPDIILGDMDSVSDAALRCGAHLIVHAYKNSNSGTDGHAPGLSRVHALGLTADTFAVPGTSEDAALLLAYEHGANLLVAVGTHSNLEDFLDKGRAGMASTFLVRLKVGPRLVDARGVYQLYRPAPPGMAFVGVILAALFPLVVLLVYSPAPILRNLVETVRLWWRLHVR